MDLDVSSGPASSGLRPVVAAVICQAGRFLLARRAPHKQDGGCWEFPGGQVETGETPEAALVRELMEELRVEAAVGRLVYQTFERGRSFLAFEADILAGTPALVDHDEIRWVQDGEFDDLPMHRFDHDVAARLLPSAPASGP